MSIKNRRMRAGIGSGCSVTALLIIWSCRAALEGDLYVSAMGAPGMPTAPWFNLALLLVAAAAVMVSSAIPDERSAVRVLSLWGLGATLLVSGAMFAFASVVTCSPGCPVPFSASSTVQDLLHVSAAVLGFAGAVFAMMQVWASTASAVRRAASGAAVLFVGAAALAGAFASLAGWAGGAGGWFEFAATTAALAWLAGLGFSLASDRREVTRWVEDARDDDSLRDSVRFDSAG